MEPRFTRDFTNVPARGSGGEPFEEEADEQAERIGASSRVRRGTRSADFAGIRIHTDPIAARSARAMDALAYASGSHIVFDAGAYQPHTAGGRALIAHELTHTIQQHHAPTLQLKRTAKGFFSQLGHLAVAFSDKSLQDYLRRLDDRNEIEDDYDSDDKARQIAEKWSNGDTRYVLTQRRKALLVRELLAGHFSGADQKRVLDLLERSDNLELDYIFKVGKVGHATLLDAFDTHRRQLYVFYMRRYPDAYPADTRSDLARGSEELEPSAPDRTKVAALDASGEAVQLADALPKSPVAGGAKRLPTKRRTAPPSQLEALAWVQEVYGAFVPKDASERAKRTTVDVERSDTGDRFEAFLAICLRDRHPKTKEERERVIEECNAEETKVGAVYSRENDAITLREGRETPSTMLHEVVHSLAHDIVDEAQRIARFAKEGMTEYLTRRVALRHRVRGKEKPLAVGGLYVGPYDAVQELAIVVGDDLIARVYFQGAVTELCRRLGKGTFDAWNDAMKSREGGQRATQILRARDPTTPGATQGCE